MVQEPVEDHCDHVKSNALPGRLGPAGVLARDAVKVGALFLTDSALWQSVLVASSRLYFYENQMLAFPGDQIGFGIACRQAIIAGHDDKAFAAQVAVREVLAAAAESQLRIPGPLPGRLPEPVKQGSDHLPEVVARTT